MSTFGSINRVQLMGNLGRDPEIKNLQAGNRVGKFSIATTDGWKDKDTGDWKEKTEWHNVVVWNDRLIKAVDKYLKKGTKVYVEGALQTRKWQDQSGQDRYSTEVVLTGYDAKLFVLSGGRAKDEDDSRESSRSEEKPRRPVREDIDDEIPF